MVRVMKNAMQPEEERRFGRHIARDIRHDDERDDQHRPDRGERLSLRLLFPRGATVGRGA